MSISFIPSRFCPASSPYQDPYPSIPRQRARTHTYPHIHVLIDGLLVLAFFAIDPGTCSIVSQSQKGLPLCLGQRDHPISSQSYELSSASMCDNNNNSTNNPPVRLSCSFPLKQYNSDRSYGMTENISPCSASLSLPFALLAFP